MKVRKKLLMYAVLPVVGVALLGASSASAHGWFGGGMSNLTPTEVASRETAMFQSQANLLDISVAEVKDAWAEGKSILEIAEAKGITKEQLQEKMLAAKKTKMTAHLQTLVDEGVITEAQMQKRLASIEVKGLIGKKGMMHGGSFGF